MTATLHTTKKLALIVVCFFTIVSAGLLLAAPFAEAAPASYSSITNFGNNTTLNAPDSADPEAYLASLFNVFVVVASILAVIRLMICGLQYMTSESVSSKGSAKTCISYVIGGLFMILLSVIVLQQINTEFGTVNFSSIRGPIQDAALQNTPGATASAPASNPILGPGQSGYDIRYTGSFGFCYEGDGGYFGFHEIRCYGTNAVCEADATEYDNYGFQDIDTSNIARCAEQIDSEWGSVRFFYDVRDPSNPNDYRREWGGDAIGCNENRIRRIPTVQSLGLEVTPCYHPSF